MRVSRPKTAKLGLVARLKQHHMFRVASWYATAAYVIILAANAVFPDVGLTREDVRYVIAGLALGFPLALTLGWVFIPPSRVDPKELSRWRRLRWRLGTVASIVVTGFVVASGVYLWRVNERHLNQAAGPAPAKSVAVLPFEDLSGNPDNAYFSAGIQDEILTRLAKVSALQVTSRTSTLQYASHPENLRKVGAELGVAAVLEGSVQRAGDKVRVNVQLIDTASDDHLWAESYDGDVKDIFATESGIAAKVADSMQATLLPAESAEITAVSTKDPIAYDLYLRAEYLFRPLDAGQVADEKLDSVVAQIVALYTQAIKQDPRFLLAYAHRSRTQAFAYWSRHGEHPALLAAARRDAETALALDPASPDAHLAMGYVHYFGRSDYAKALLEFEGVSRDFPNDPEVIMAIAMVHRRLGDTEVIADIRRAEALDPHDIVRYIGFEVSSDAAGGRYDEALQAVDRYHALYPDDLSYYADRAGILLKQGRLHEARTALDQYPPGERDDPDYIPQAFELARLERDPGAMLKAIAPLHQTMADDQIPLALMQGVAYRMAHRDAEATAAFASAVATLQAVLGKEPLNPDLWDLLAYAQALRGEKAAAVQSAEKAMALLPVAQDALNGGKYIYGLAEAQVLGGEVKDAVATLGQALSEIHGGEFSVAELKLDPDWDAARKDPGFIALLDKYGPTEH